MGRHNINNKSVFEFVTFFQNRGYDIPSGFYDLYFTVIPALHLEAEPISKLGPILKTLIVKDEKTERTFDFDFHDFLHNIWPPSKESMKDNVKKKSELDSYIKEQEKNLESLKKEEKRRKKRLEELKDEESEILKKNKEEAMAKKKKDIENELEGLYVSAKISESIKKEIKKLESESTIHNFNIGSIKKVREAILKMMKNAVLLKNFKAVLAYLKELSDVIDAVEKKKGGSSGETARLYENIKNITNMQKQTQKNIDNALQEASLYDDKLIRKIESVIHRDKFQPYGNAVQIIKNGKSENEIFDKEFSKLTAEEKDAIKQYIYENARQFRTRLSRNIRTIHRDEIDIAETCKKACSTDGIPMQLMYKKPVPQRTKLLMFLDVSGSCKGASELMLYFMYYMKEIFKGGCKTYAFVNSLYDISGMFDLMNPEESIKKILNVIPTKGVYSNYYDPLKEFYEEHFSDVTKDTLVFFIGDARNNKNDSGVEYIRAISRKCKRFYWMNTENYLKWDIKDSIIGTYKPYLNIIFETINTSELLKSLEEIK